MGQAVTDPNLIQHTCPVFSVGVYPDCDGCMSVWEIRERGEVDALRAENARLRAALAKAHDAAVAMAHALVDEVNPRLRGPR